MAAPRVIPALVMTTCRRGWLAPFLDWLDAFLYTLIGANWFPVRVLTAAALPANTYSAITQTKTASANGTLTVDGVLLAVGDRLWDKDAATGSQRGLFAVTDAGAAGGGGRPWKAIRATDANTSSQYVEGKAFDVTEGTAAGGTAWHLTNATFTLDTTTPAIARETNVMHTDDAQTVSALKKFATLVLAVWNAGSTFVTKFATSATVDRTFTLPDWDGTPAQATAATGSTTPGASSGTAPAFTGTTPTSATQSHIAGTGGAAVGQVFTTTDTQTVAANELAGMWLVTATLNPPLYIVSNLVAAGAAVAITVMGPLTTDAGAYRVLKAPTPVGSVASHTHTGAAHTHAQV